MEVWVTTVTNRGLEFLSNILNNFTRQKYEKKKLCLILNSNININLIKLFTKNIDVTVLSFPNKTLGECLNQSILLMPKTSDIWVKMDDDDYYGEGYLLTNISSLIEKKADIVGRRDMYIYVPELRKLYFMKNGGENKYVDWVQGASLTIKKEVFKLIKFPNLNKGEDTFFFKHIKSFNLKIYATSKTDFVVLRHIDISKHTWKKNIHHFLKNSIFLGKKISHEFETKYLQ